MTSSPSARVVMPCAALEPCIDFFCERLGFMLDNIWPADSPAQAIVSTEGLTIELRVDRQAAGNEPIHVVFPSDSMFESGIRKLTAPNGAVFEIVRSAPQIVMPPLQISAAYSALDADTSWITGRAGMRYRDLIPDRLGGRYIASHIQIPNAGPVPDYVHFHDVRFQMIFCAKGWVRVVYEDQGEPFVLNAGDCVLQPPRIRHRVLESSDGLEVIEIGSPAEHLTTREHSIELPTGVLRPHRDFGGQNFVRHVARDATYGSWRSVGFESRDTGIAKSTRGLADVRVARPLEGTHSSTPMSHAAELLLLFVLGGTGTLTAGGRGSMPLRRGTSVVIPAADEFQLAECSADFELLDVSVG